MEGFPKQEKESRNPYGKKTREKKRVWQKPGRGAGKEDAKVHNREIPRPVEV
jgi:hypothetical protein